MKKGILVGLFISAMALGACGTDSATYALAPELEQAAVYVEIEEVEAEAIEAEEVAPQINLGEYGYHAQVAAEFLSQMTSIFTGVFREQVDWSSGEPVGTGEFWGWDNVNRVQIITDEMPEIALMTLGDRRLGFFGKDGERIYEAPWMSTYQSGEWSTSFYASYFRIMDLDDNGIPEILIHFQQTFDGGYAGFYRIFRYVDGEYRILELRGVSDGETQERIGLGGRHRFFRDALGRTVAHTDSMYHGMLKYEQLTILNGTAEFHLLLEMDGDNWEAWESFHWITFDNATGRWEIADAWFLNEPTIFGTDIALAIIEPEHAIEVAITKEIMRYLGL